MRETDYVEMAFYAGWLEALGFPSMGPQEMELMVEAMRSPVAEMVSDYVLRQLEVSDAGN